MHLFPKRRFPSSETLLHLVVNQSSQSRLQGLCHMNIHIKGDTAIGPCGTRTHKSYAISGWASLAREHGLLFLLFLLLLFKNIPVFFNSSCYNRILWTVWHMSNRNLFCTVLEAGWFKIKVLVCRFMSGEKPLPGS